MHDLSLSLSLLEPSLTTCTAFEAFVYCTFTTLVGIPVVACTRYQQCTQYRILWSVETAAIGSQSFSTVEAAVSLKLPGFRMMHQCAV